MILLYLLKRGLHIDIYKIPNYTSIHTIRNNKRGGGVAIYINNNLNFNILHNLTFTIDNLIDICTIELIYNNTNIILSSIYRPPDSNIDSFTNIISNYLHSISHNKTVYLCGDFNIDIFKHNNNKHIKDFIDNIYQFGYHPLINKCTRITYTSKSIIDNIYTNNNNIPFINGLLMSDVSDHLLIIVLYKNHVNINNNKTKNKRTTLFNRSLNKNNINNIRNVLINYNWSSILDNDDIESSFIDFNYKSLS